MQEQTYPSPRSDAPPIPATDEERARQEGRQQLDRMLDEYRRRFVLRRESRCENLTGSAFEGG